MEDRYPGYDLDRKKVGCLSSDRIVVADELTASWE
jgi:hypothetical protein